MLSNEPGQEPAAAPPLPPGTSLGSYVLYERIGYGAMGAVYRAEHRLLKKAVAIKIMAAPLLDNADARERFLREGQTAAALEHPNVVDVTDVGIAGTTPFLVMELLQGEDLEALLERRKDLAEWEVAELIVPIVAALASAHAQGVVHRDLKPSNIFVARGNDGEITPKVLDFGICKLVQALGPDLHATPFNQLMGSPSYLSPEALKGSCHVSDRCDQYSLGVVLYECVTGRTPFLGETLYSLLGAILTGQFVRPKESRPDVSPLMEGIILRAMKADPEARFLDMRELGRALLEVARPRTQLLWGPTFGYSDPSAGVGIENHGLEASADPRGEAARGAPSRPKPISKRLAGAVWLMSFLVAGYLFTGLRSAWQTPAAAAVNPDPALLVSVPVATRAESVAQPASVELVLQPIALDVMPDAGAARPVEPIADAPVAEAREASQRKGVSRRALKPSKHRARRALPSAARPATGLEQLGRTPATVDDPPPSAALANEAPILD